MFIYLNKYSNEWIFKCLFAFGVGIGAAAQRAVPEQAKACEGMKAKAGTAESPTENHSYPE